MKKNRKVKYLAKMIKDICDVDINNVIPFGEFYIFGESPFINVANVINGYVPRLLYTSSPGGPIDGIIITGFYITQEDIAEYGISYHKDIFVPHIHGNYIMLVGDEKIKPPSNEYKSYAITSLNIKVMFYKQEIMDTLYRDKCGMSKPTFYMDEIGFDNVKNKN